MNTAPDPNSRPTHRSAARLNLPSTLTSGSAAHLMPTLPLPKSGSHPGRDAAHARSLFARLSDRDISILVTLARLRLVTGRQIQRLFLADTAPVTAARRSRAILQRLTDLRAVVRLERRVGGVRAGSDGHLYGLSGLGRAALMLTGDPLPGGKPIGTSKPAFQDHLLAVSELYVRLLERQRDGGGELLSFTGEPDCWRRYPGPGGGWITLKPDAFVALGVSEYEQHAFVEMDLGTESGPTLLRKCQRYVDYWRSGLAEQGGGIFPRVWWLAPSDVRLTQIAAVIARLTPDVQDLFATARISEAAEALATDDEPGATS